MDINFSKDKKKLNNIKTFISVTREIINKEGIENVSIRKISNLSKLHNSTIYLYFDNLNELILLSCISYFDSYSKALKDFSSSSLNIEDTFLGIWNIFMKFALEKASIFEYFFFRDDKYNLENLFHIYYSIFPEEILKFSDMIKTMYYGKNIYDRSMKILLPLLDSNLNSVTTENIELINELIISYTATKIKQAIKNEKECYLLKNEFLIMLKHIIF